jgi:carbamate kinase
MTAGNQRSNVRKAAQALAPLSKDHELIISHGNGPQVGLLALQASQYSETDPYPLDVLGAQTEGMIGYLIEQELGNILPFEQPFATILTMVEVDKDDPAFNNPTKPIGPFYNEKTAEKLTKDKGWVMKPDRNKWRRVVPSPVPRRIFEMRPIKWLLEKGTIVICAGGGGIPTIYNSDGKLVGADVVIDKDYAGALLAKELDADIYIMATDADAVYSNWGTSGAKAYGRITVSEICKVDFAEGSMKPKVNAACWFVQKTGKIAGIGSLTDIQQIVEGTKGTRISL